MLVYIQFVDTPVGDYYPAVSAQLSNDIKKLTSSESFETGKVLKWACKRVSLSDSEMLTKLLNNTSKAKIKVAVDTDGGYLATEINVDDCNTASQPITDVVNKSRGALSRVATSSLFDNL